MIKQWLAKLARPEIMAMHPYSSARGEADFSNFIGLDANENPYIPLGSDDKINRYPEPQPKKLRALMANLYQVNPSQLLLCRGADEAIELLVRAFCTAYRDKIIVLTPTFNYYSIAAQMQGSTTIEIPLIGDNFQPNWQEIHKQCDEFVKIIFICTPNNPTGNLIPLSDIANCAKIHYGKAIIAVDEAYIEFTTQESATSIMQEYDNIVIFRTLSKAYGLAGERIGAMIAHLEIIDLCQKIIPPYPLAYSAELAACKALSPMGLYDARQKIQEIIQSRDEISFKLAQSPYIKRVFPSQTNFILVEANDGGALYKHCLQNGIVVRNRHGDIANTIRISIGTPHENALLLSVLGINETAQDLLLRHAVITRKTKETEIRIAIKLDGLANAKINTGNGFFDHMLEQLSRHSTMSLDVQAIGDYHIDAHHTIEDTAITIGLALKQALGDKKGIARYGFVLPMDEANTQISIDLSGRGHCEFSAIFPDAMIGDFPTNMVAHFFESLSANLGAAIHITTTGKNSHHMVESIFKAFAKTLHQAITIEHDKYPSTKGVL